MRAILRFALCFAALERLILDGTGADDEVLPLLAPLARTLEFVSVMCLPLTTKTSTRTSAGRVFRMRWKHLHAVAGHPKSKPCFDKAVVCRDNVRQAQADVHAGSASKAQVLLESVVVVKLWC